MISQSEIDFLQEAYFVATQESTNSNVNIHQLNEVIDYNNNLGSSNDYSSENQETEFISGNEKGEFSYFGNEEDSFYDQIFLTHLNNLEKNKNIELPLKKRAIESIIQNHTTNELQNAHSNSEETSSNNYLLEEEFSAEQLSLLDQYQYNYSLDHFQQDIQYQYSNISYSLPNAQMKIYPSTLVNEVNQTYIIPQNISVFQNEESQVTCAQNSTDGSSQLNPLPEEIDNQLLQSNFYYQPKIYESHTYVVPPTNNSNENFLYYSNQNILIESNTSLQYGGWPSVLELPSLIYDFYREKKRIVEPYQWQKECISSPAFINGNNMIISLPTSGGKTLIAELAILRTILLKKKKAIFILPYVSIVQEKVASLKEFSSILDMRVEGYFGSYGTLPLPSRCGVAVCTMEKGSTLVNHLIEEKRISEIGLVVVDELHMLDEPGRGFKLELLLTKMLSQKTIQIIGMSATIPNLNEISNWLQAECFQSDFRPVPLMEYCKIGLDICDKSGKIVRKLKGNIPNDHYNLFELSVEIIRNADHSVLIFCSTKNDTQDIAFQLSKIMGKQIKNYRKEEKELLIKKLKFANVGGVDKILLRTIEYGIAFHHSGLTIDERELIEEAYQNHIINILVSTSTLAAGVNLPARRVILQNPFVGREVLSVRQYRQMCGRAGRAGIDNYGESIIIIPNINHKACVFQLMNSPLENLKSCLHKDKGSAGFLRLILDAICGHGATTIESVFEFMNFTLLAHQNSENLKHEVEKALGDLIKGEFLKQTESGILPTLFGQATFHSSLSPEESLIVKNELQNCMKSLILNDELHLVYLITPIFNLPPVCWETYSKLMRSLTPSQAAIANTCGIQEELISLLESRSINLHSVMKRDSFRSTQRFYFALALTELLNEKPIAEVADKFNLNRGHLQSFMQSAQSFSSLLVHFCKMMDYWALSLLIEKYCQRLNFGVKEEIIPLTEIKGVKRFRARALYNAGLRTVRAVAAATPEELLQATSHLGPFSESAARNIIRNAKELLEQKAKELREKAEELLHSEA